MRSDALIGEGAIQTVDWMHAEFKRMCSDSRPRWIHMEAPAGVGKTRTLQELYRRMATQDQAEAPYWPMTALQRSDDAQFARKEISPSGEPPLAGSPEWLWWGISCERRSCGSRLTALRSDIVQIALHADALAETWNRDAVRAQKVEQMWRAHRVQLLQMGIGVAVSPIPGGPLSQAACGQLLSVLAKRVSGLWARKDTDPLAGYLVSDADEKLAGECVAAVRAMAAVVPVVIAVEDFHRSDSTLLRVLGDCLKEVGTMPCKVLVITTALPGLVPTEFAKLGNCAPLDRQWQLADGLARRGDGAEDRISEDSPWEWKATNRHELALQLLRQLGVDSPVVSAQAVAAVCATPLEIELELSTQRVQTALEENGEISVADLPDSSTGLRDVVGRLWIELPEVVQHQLILASMMRPSEIRSGSSDGRWDPVLISLLCGTPVEGPQRSGTTERPGPIDGWACLANDGLRRFIDRARERVTSDHCSDSKYASQVRLHDVHREALTMLTTLPQAASYDHLDAYRGALATAIVLDADDDNAERLRAEFAGENPNLKLGYLLQSAASAVFADRSSDTVALALDAARAAERLDGRLADLVPMIRFSAAVAHHELGDLQDSASQALLALQGVRVLGAEDLVFLPLVASFCADANRYDDVLQVMTADVIRQIATRVDDGLLLPGWLHIAGMARAHALLAKDEPLATLSCLDDSRMRLGSSFLGHEAAALRTGALELEALKRLGRKPSTTLVRSAMHAYEESEPLPMNAAVRTESLKVILEHMLALDATEDLEVIRLNLQGIDPLRTDPAWGALVNNLGARMFARKRYQDAHGCFEEALEWYRKWHGPTSPETTQVVANLKAAEMGHGRIDPRDDNL